jgi:hypothetical protein
VGVEQCSVVTVRPVLSTATSYSLSSILLASKEPKTRTSPASEMSLSQARVPHCSVLVRASGIGGLRWCRQKRD